MKHDIDILCNPLSIYTNVQVDISKHLEKKSRKLFDRVKPANLTTDTPFQVF